MSHPGLSAIHVRQDHPDFLDLPWHLPLVEWHVHTRRIVQITRGISRHEVLFASYADAVYAFKELPPAVGEREYDLLRELEKRKLPAVLAVGHARARRAGGSGEEASVLITRFLDSSLPYRILFMNPGLERYRERLLDAMASLLVRLHLAGFYWGDCSLSNTLFRRDAGELQAYAVDAETSEVHDTISDGMRRHDLDILEENVTGELADLAAVVALPETLSVYETGEMIRARYERLWSEVNREIVVSPSESFKIHERIRALNELGFSVGEVDLIAAGDGEHLKMRTIVTDRDYHSQKLHSLTGIDAGERKAALLLSEIKEMKAVLSSRLNRSVPLSVSAYRWLEERYFPTTQQLQPLLPKTGDLSELYCEVLEHKWYMSERAQRDIGLEAAIEDYLARFREDSEPPRLA